LSVAYFGGVGTGDARTELMIVASPRRILPSIGHDHEKHSKLATIMDSLVGVRPGAVRAGSAGAHRGGRASGRARIGAGAHRGGHGITAWGDTSAERGAALDVIVLVRFSEGTW
jgi:hypothetical protein